MGLRVLRTEGSFIYAYDEIEKIYLLMVKLKKFIQIGKSFLKNNHGKQLGLWVIFKSNKYRDLLRIQPKFQVLYADVIKKKMKGENVRRRIMIEAQQVVETKEEKV